MMPPQNHGTIGNIKPFLHVEAAGAQRAVDEDQGERIMLAGDAASSRRSA